MITHALHIIIRVCIPLTGIDSYFQDLDVKLIINHSSFHSMTKKISAICCTTFSSLQEPLICDAQSLSWFRAAWMASKETSSHGVLLNRESHSFVLPLDSSWVKTGLAEMKPLNRALFWDKEEQNVSLPKLVGIRSLQGLVKSLLICEEIVD